MISKEEQYMERCLRLAQLGAGHVAPNPMVGAVLVYHDKIIGEGYHQQYGGPHAEVNCINSVSEEQRKYIPESTIYVSLEPCAHFGKTPPCADLIIKNKIPRVVVGCRDPFEAVNGKGIEKLKAAGITVEMSELKAQCIFLNRRFFTFHERKRPYILLKWAQTADGFIARANQHTGERLLISNEMTNRMVHRWRNEESAILVGTQTALLDNPLLTNRLWTGNSPLRMVIDRKGILPVTHKLLDSSIATVVFTEKTTTGKENLHFERIRLQQDSIDAILSFSYQHNIQSIMVEGGSQLHQSFLKRGLWDEIRIITNEALYIGAGIPIPQIGSAINPDRQQRIGNNRIDFIYGGEAKTL